MSMIVYSEKLNPQYNQNSVLTNYSALDCLGGGSRDPPGLPLATGLPSGALRGGIWGGCALPSAGVRGCAPRKFLIFTCKFVHFGAFWCRFAPL